MFDQLKKNSVSSANQLKDNWRVRFYNPEGKGIRVVFVGNSMTLHGVSEEIGWNRCCGMAASSEDKDYVHILMNKISQKQEDAAFCICQVSDWERNYKTGEDTFQFFEEARDFNADVIIARFIENCPAQDFDEELFKEQYSMLLDYLDGESKAKMIITDGFWRHPGDKAINEVANMRKADFVSLGDLGERDEMKAIGLFEHTGVANHPGDLGMQTIAERIWEKIDKI